MSPSANCGENTNEYDPSTGNGVPNIEKMGGKMLINKLAGEGVVKVVKQCENAKETLTLGEFLFGLVTLKNITAGSCYLTGTII